MMVSVEISDTLPASELLSIDWDRSDCIAGDGDGALDWNVNPSDGLQELMGDDGIDIKNAMESCCFAFISFEIPVSLGCVINEIAISFFGFDGDLDGEGGLVSGPRSNKAENHAMLRSKVEQLK